MQCYHCGRMPNKRRWKQGLESWSYVPYRQGLRRLKRWWCGECNDFVDAEYPEETTHEAEQTHD